MEGTIIRVLIADDHALFREGLKAVLDRQKDIDIVGFGADGKEAVREARRATPDVIVIDLFMLGMNGNGATRRLIEELPDAAILCLSSHSGRQFVEAALHVGASGYLLKDCRGDELVEAIRSVAAGQFYLSPAIGFKLQGILENKQCDTCSANSAFSSLSGRERDVLKLIAEGMPTKEIAWRLDISPKTIGTHREHIMEKLDIHSVAGLTKYAIREGLTSAED